MGYTSVLIMKEENIHRVLDIGIKMICQKGYSSLGLRELLEKAKIPSGSFYYYFKSKEDFALKAIVYYSDMVEAYFQERLLKGTGNRIDRFSMIFDEEMERMKESDLKEGCVLGDVTSEIAGELESVRVLAEQKYSQWQVVIEQFFREGQGEGELNSDFDPEEMAMFFLSNRQGAMTRVKSSKSLRPYEIFKSQMIRMIVA